MTTQNDLIISKLKDIKDSVKSLDGKVDGLTEITIKTANNLEHLKDDVCSEKQKLTNVTTSFSAFKSLHEQKLAEALNHIGNIDNTINRLSKSNTDIEKTLKKTHEINTIIGCKLEEIQKENDAIVKRNVYDRKIVKFAAVAGVLVGIVIASFKLVTPTIAKLLH